MGESIDGAELFVRAAADVKIEDGIVLWQLESGKFRFILRATPDVLAESIMRSIACYNDWVRKTGGSTLHLCDAPDAPKGKRKH